VPENNTNGYLRCDYVNRETTTDALVIAAHPDDEVLGCGGALARWTDEGSTVNVVFLADGVGGRKETRQSYESESACRREAARSACSMLGTEPPAFCDLPDNRLDTLPLLNITQLVEQFIREYHPGTVLTHHAGDVNIDHQRVHQAVVTACRPQPGHSVRQLLFFEVASSTEWQPPGSAPVFAPNVFVDISSTLERKLAALRAYEEELRPWPHTRSIEAVEHQARWRGATVGREAAEAFILGRDIL